jgi:uncharacterized protein (UPF0548 family)
VSAVTEDRLARLRDLPLSYREVGATGTALPAGYRHVARYVAVGRGADAFTAAGERLMTWGVHRDAGVRVDASAPRAANGVDVLLTVGPSWSPIGAPCRVVHVHEESDRLGFTYGTLKGHPLRGEESFSVLLEPDETVRFVIIAFSQPASMLARLGAPFGRWVQRQLTERFVSAAEAAATPA